MAGLRCARALCGLTLAGCAGSAGASQARPSRFTLPAPNAAQPRSSAGSAVVEALVYEGPAVPLAGAVGTDGPLRVEQILANVDARYRTMTDFGVEFGLDVANGSRSLTSRTNGVVWFAAGGRMHWDHISRPGFRVVCNGATVRVQSRTLPAPQIVPVAQSELAAAFAFMTGTATLVGDLRATMRPPVPGAPRVFFVVDLLPRRPHPALASMTIAVEATSFLVREVVVVDTSGGYQRFSFLLPSMRENRGVGAAFFQ